jgi:hypothetical protein
MIRRILWLFGTVGFGQALLVRALLVSLEDVGSGADFSHTVTSRTGPDFERVQIVSGCWTIHTLIYYLDQ